MQPKIVALLVFSTFAGFWIAHTSQSQLAFAIYAVFGVLFGAAGAEFFNKVLEIDIDKQMRRTEMRSTVRKIVSIKTMLIAGTFLILFGVVIGALANTLTALMIALGVVFYVLVYTVMLKRRSRLNVIIGGLAGSFCVWAGVTAAVGTLTLSGFMLGFLVLAWIPGHIWSLALKYKKDYIKAGVPMLSAVESERNGALAIAGSNIFMAAVSVLLAAFLNAYYIIIMIIPITALMYLSLKVVADKTKAWLLFKFSSPYLLMVFIAILIATSV
ncbi:MAG: heme o synthase [Candidatus Marsarchaeota archaeon]|nr:heme o synthase [Candidatus Marsarchaeota archaeon]